MRAKRGAGTRKDRLEVLTLFPLCEHITLLFLFPEMNREQFHQAALSDPTLSRHTHTHTRTTHPRQKIDFFL